jgi:hypothetical protein
MARGTYQCAARRDAAVALWRAGRPRLHYGQSNWPAQPCAGVPASPWPIALKSKSIMTTRKNKKGDQPGMYQNQSPPYDYLGNLSSGIADYRVDYHLILAVAGTNGSLVILGEGFG